MTAGQAIGERYGGRLWFITIHDAAGRHRWIVAEPERWHTTPTFSFTNATEVPRPPGSILTTPGFARNYEMAPDGTHFVIALDRSDAPAGANTEIEVVLNWGEELKQRVPTK